MNADSELLNVLYYTNYMYKPLSLYIVHLPYSGEHWQGFFNV